MGVTDAARQHPEPRVVSRERAEAEAEALRPVYALIREIAERLRAEQQSRDEGQRRT